MHRLSLSELEQQRADFDALVVASGVHGHFSNSLSWSLSAHEAFGAERMPWIWRAEDSFVTFARRWHPRGFFFLEPLEAQWGLAVPVAAPTSDIAVDVLHRALSFDDGEWAAAVVTGVVTGSGLEELLTSRLAGNIRQTVPGTGRFVASLEGGADGFWSRRSSKLRRTVRRARKLAADEGVTIEVAEGHDAEALYRRMLSVERKSWKGQDGTGLVEEPMRSFYERMLPRLGADARVRFAVRDGCDVGYICGAVFGDTYRGLQFSFDDDMRPLGLGNVLQSEEIESLCREGVLHYDLGATGGHYKARWADREIASSVWVVGPT